MVMDFSLQKVFVNSCLKALSVKSRLGEPQGENRVACMFLRPTFPFFIASSGKCYKKLSLLYLLLNG